jgi:hypothetical protein
MTWDPETDDLGEARRRMAEREPSDVGSDTGREFGDEPAPAWRDHAPDPLAPIDPDSPVSGHMPPATTGHSAMETPEHDWARAAALLYPTFRPVGTQGLRFDDIDAEALAAQTGRAHVAPIVDEGPCGLPVVYSIPAGGFDIIVNGEHLLSWAVEPASIQDAALGNLASWSAAAAWTDEVSGNRRLLSSDTGEGWDAVRILLPEVRQHLARELGASGRVLIGLPERHLLVAGSLRPDDGEFAALFAEFIVEQSGGADEPIDRRVFELVDGQLVEFAGAAGA